MEMGGSGTGVIVSRACLWRNVVCSWRISQRNRSNNFASGKACLRKGGGE